MISAFKNIRLSGQSLIPSTKDGTMRLNLNGSGLAYYSEITGISGSLQDSINFLSTGSNELITQVSGELNDKITSLSGDFTNFVSGLDLTYVTDAELSGTVSGLLSGIDSTGQYILNNFIPITDQQSFLVGIPQGVESTGISFPINFSTVPSFISITLETSGDVFYGTSIRSNSKTISGFMVDFSDNIYEDGINLNVFSKL